jgi:hypothetical protein
MYNTLRSQNSARIAQLARASPCQGEGRGFESRFSLMNEVSQYPSSPSLRLNEAHSKLLEALKSARIQRNSSEQAPVNLKQGERLLTADQVIELYKNPTLTEEHIVTLQTINQQTKQALTRL